MKRIMIKIAYDGTNYKGWQSGNKQNNKFDCIEDILNYKISKLTGENIKIIGTSRTDSGVHSNGNIAVFDTESDIRPDKFFYALNNILPDDISILMSKEVDLNFHPRKCPAKKTYIYRIHNSKIRNPLYEHFAHFVYYDINIDKMIEASKYLIGVHDFKSFINPESIILKIANKNNINNENITTREIYSIDISKHKINDYNISNNNYKFNEPSKTNNDINLINDIIEIKISGNGFLYHMVRIICGTLLKIGMNMWEPQYIKEILDKKDRRFAGWTLEAKGLTLQNIEF